MTLEQALRARRSKRRLTESSIPIDSLSQLLWAAQGNTSRRGFRAAPSAGSLYPLEILAAVGHVDGIVPGVYRYLPAEHALERRQSGDPRPALAAAAWHQEWIRKNAVVLVVAGVQARTRAKYGDRAERYVWMEAGHAAQNMLLQAASLDLGAVPVGSFDDERVRRASKLLAGEDPLYLLAIGAVAGVRAATERTTPEAD